MNLDTIYLEIGSVEALEATAAFYRDALGLTVASEEAHESVWLTSDNGVTLGLHVGEPLGNPGAVNICFRVDDVDAAAAEVVGRGAVLEQEPQDAPWGDRIATMFDPAGHAVWLLGPRRG